MKHISKITALILAVCVIIPCLCVAISSAEYVSAGTKGDTPASESYQRSKYYTYLTDTKLTGDEPTDVIAIALSQLGYKEGNSLDELGGLSSGGGNFSEYNWNFGDFSSGYSYHWCAAFVSFCLLQAGCHDLNTLKDWCRDHPNDSGYIWRELGCEKWRVALKDAGFFKTSIAHQSTNSQKLSESFDPEYTPSAGDLIFFTDNPYKTASHIGIVLYIENDIVYTIEGNTRAQDGLETDGDGVYIKSYSLFDTKITGFADMPYKTDESVQKIDYSGKTFTAGTYMSRADIAVFETKDAAAAQDATTAKAILPMYSMLSASEVYDDGIFYIECVIGEGKMTGYIKGAGQTIQTAVTTSELHIPEDSGEIPTLPQASSSGGCNSFLYINTAMTVICLLASGAVIFKKKKY